MKTLLAFLVAAVLALAADDAVAQAPPVPMAPGTLGGILSAQAVTASSSNAALPATIVPYGAVTVVNTGTKDAYIAFGGSGVTAATTNTPVRAGKHITIWLQSGSYIAAICGGTDTTTLDIYQGTGFVGFGP
jgi:hypothetical protein